MRIALRLVSLLVLSLAFALALADSSIRLTTFPTYLAPSDGRSTVSIKAEIRDQSGHAIIDGTRVVFTSNIGTFRENIVATSGGAAFATLIAPTAPGIANITATALSGDASPGVATIEFVDDRNLLNSAKEYIEIVASG
jgi:hypothetical protein